ncbi:EAL domain-containing protein [Desulfobacter vibrioformis]|uniref:EAL domain-containing protein n=1 Tax=Desulfobacter vibrioformis TaxID=34031 RepID=UPI000A009871|nr:EAL domain-containing protein [Desulfobacter vibrioformis]
MKASFKLDLTCIRQWTREDRPYITGIADGNRFHTALQPIYSLAHRRIVGHEALVRVFDMLGNSISPASIFDREMSNDDMIQLDRLCRWLHLQNFKLIKDPLNWLFLNVSGQTLARGLEYGSFFKDAIDAAGIPAHRIVIEVVEHPFENPDWIIPAIRYYKELGCLIALDDFGAGHSNFDRIWTLKPDIVKLDRSFLTRANNNRKIQNLFPGIVSLLHQAGSLVLMEGIETQAQAQALIAIESDVDFVQGFYFARPFTDLLSLPPVFDQFPMLMNRYKNERDCTDIQFQDKLVKYRTLFINAVGELKKGKALFNACSELLDDPMVVRCYNIGTNGIQIGNTLVGKHYVSQTDKRFKPLEDARSADWFRRHYLRRAITHPGQIQVTRPYLSITGAHMCITLSMKFSNPSGNSVLCCDLMGSW